MTLLRIVLTTVDRVRSYVGRYNDTFLFRYTMRCLSRSHDQDFGVIICEAYYRFVTGELYRYKLYGTVRYFSV